MSRWYVILPKIYSEGYCCMYGYLELCKARGETSNGMAENLGIKPHTLRHHYRQLKKGECTCEGKTDCMKALLEEIKKAP